MFASAYRAIIVLSLLASCGWGEPSFLDCEDPSCIMEVIVKNAQLIAVESEMVEAVAVVETTNGLRVTMIGECAYGNFAKSKVRFEYAIERPEWVSALLTEERLPSVAVPKKIIERRSKTEFTREGDGVFRKDIICFKVPDRGSVNPSSLGDG